MGKRDSHHHSTMSFRENVIVVETSYQMFRYFIILQSGEGLPVTSSNKGKSVNFRGELESTSIPVCRSIFHR